MAEDDRLERIARVREAPVDPHRRILDAHHHLHAKPGSRTSYLYRIEDFEADAGSGHNVVKSVFIECRESYLEDGPKALQPIGETIYVAEAAARASQKGPAEIAAIVGFADLTLGDAVEEVLQAHEAAGDGRFRGIRYQLALDTSEGVPNSPHAPPPTRMDEESFRAGLARLGALGYSFDAWVFHPQLHQFAGVVAANQETTFIVNHLGAPLGIGPYAERRGREVWKTGMRELAAFPNVTVKLGGIGMDFSFGTGWSSSPQAPDSDEVVAFWGDDIHFLIDTFGPSRCMFESNYPVDSSSIGYTVLWNAFQKIAASYTEEEQDELFYDAAARAYRIG